jgi:hypothetical protein
LFYDGSQWTVILSQPDTNFVQVWGPREGLVFAAGEGGLWRIEGGVPEPVERFSNLAVTGVGGVTEDDMFVIAERRLLHFDGEQWLPVALNELHNAIGSHNGQIALFERSLAPTGNQLYRRTW